MASIKLYSYRKWCKVEPFQVHSNNCGLNYYSTVTVFQEIGLRGKHFPTCMVPVTGLYLFSHMYGSSLYLWIACTSFPTCTVPSKYALRFFGTCMVKTPFNKQQFHKNQWLRNILMTNYVSKQIHRLSFK